MAEKKNNGSKRKTPSKKKIKYVTLGTLKMKYGFSVKFIAENFPEPELRKNPHYRSAAPMKLWDEKVVERTLKKKAVVAELERIAKRKAKKAEKEKQKAERIDLLRERMLACTPASLIERSKELDRKFVIHYGPTNSGKTYDAIQCLKKAENGVYLGPLRLLALEMFDKINADNIPCNLLTGEEYEYIEDAKITASTIEMCNYRMRYDVGVIDEAQMVCDKDRGGHWLKALCLLNAREIHICIATEALELIENLAKDIGLPYEIIEHKRFVPLVFSGHCNGLNDIKEHDAIITFSRKNVLNIAGHLEKRGIKSSVIYGALPPASRREEVRKYVNGETSVVVATDAIGMGISLPIRRIVFSEVSKFDGEKRRFLTYSEIKQIAGRAGRYKMFDLGEVLSMSKDKLIQDGLEKDAKKLSRMIIPFPIEIINEGEYTLKELLTTWASLPPANAFARENVDDAIKLLPHIERSAKKMDAPHEFVYDLITCPVNIQSDELVYYWANCANEIINGKEPPLPYFGTETLIKCELQYCAYDIYHQLMRRIGIEVINDKEKEEVSKKINEFLLKDKDSFVKKCRYCGKTLPLNYKYNICEKCYRSNFNYYDRNDYDYHDEFDDEDFDWESFVNRGLDFDKKK